MLDICSKRVALITGKGGVGRTTLSAALAKAAAAQGVRVLLTEIGEPDGDYTPRSSVENVEPAHERRNGFIARGTRSRRRGT